MAQKTFAGGSRFAHLLGRGKKTGAAKAEDDTDEDEKARKAKKAEGGGDLDDPDENEDEKKDKLDDNLDEHTDDEGKTDVDDEEEAKKAKGKGAAADDDDDDDAAKRAKRAKAKTEDGDDESDDKDDKDTKASAARRRERARCASIFASPAAAKRPDFAAHLAFSTGMNRGSALAMLEAAAGGETDEAPQQKPKGSLRQRMERTPAPEVGPDSGRKPATGAAGFAEGMARAIAIRDGKA